MANFLLGDEFVAVAQMSYLPGIEVRIETGSGAGMAMLDKPSSMDVWTTRFAVESIYDSSLAMTRLTTMLPPTTTADAAAAMPSLQQ